MLYSNRWIGHHAGNITLVTSRWQHPAGKPSVLVILIDGIRRCNEVTEKNA
ncbi:MAG: hypothetical protein KDA99_26310 [Planctomycetales bacterium]|nr:hypothetical protein [Planctomycetales bacterium]